jgi:transcription-repair coupling factor (superfamily II helicase)
VFGSARGWLAAQLSAKHRPLIIVCKNRKAAEEIRADLEFFSPEHRTLLYPSWETIPFELVSPAPDIAGLRLRTLYELSHGLAEVVVTSADALLHSVPPKQFIEALTFRVRAGDAATRVEIAQQLENAGYQSVSLVEAPGEVAVHGLVIDVFPAFGRVPLRIEFEDERITSIKEFDPETQRSSGSLTEVVLTPVRESIPLHSRPEWKELLLKGLEHVKDRAAELETPVRELTRITDALAQGSVYPGMEIISSLALQQSASFFDFVPAHASMFILDGIGCQQALDTLDDSIEERAQRLADEHYLFPRREALFLTPAKVFESLERFERFTVDHLEVLDELKDSDQAPVHFRSEANTELTTKLKTKVGTGDGMKPLSDFVTRFRKKGYDVAFVVGSQARAERLQRLLLEIDFDAPSLASSGNQWIAAPHRYPVVILQGHLTDGFSLHEQKLLFIAEHEVFSEKSYRTSRKAKTSLKRLLGTLSLLNNGDHVVHVDYGVGKYCGLLHREVEGSESDFLHIEYADSVLFLPVQNIGKIQKFVAAEGQQPALDKLSSTRWVKTKQKVREQVATLAGDLIKLYASRSIVKGWRFEPFGAEDERFAEQFPFDETPDQLKAIEESLADLAEDKPMDRLVCGDVGFGKTEVAIRAAFKVVQHARQVAVLVPTTILTEQHYQSFINRFQGYPTKLGCLSRFHTAEENKKTLEQLASGELDIIVGTHRLLSRDVVFKDLGLLIIDEEHRFGVKQKEKLKALKKNVDVLTLTATPIPRTLHMSLLGIRDISLISTPPVDRRVIRTYTATYDEALIRDVVLRELQRGGQCFYVHNRVQNIDITTSLLQRLVPEARFGFAHGQMTERQLEPIMRRFMNKELDVLVSTSIIESGIDIPNANTMIIDRADTFGLAQLYQLRGRVGRSSRQAYCYFLIPKTRTLGGEAQQRLKALQALDDLGLGFNLAMRDLEIRGAGNLLGREQSGSVLAVGFELYSKILKEAILNLKGEEVDVRESIDPEIKLGMSAFIPDNYIPDVSERLVLYQRFAAITTMEETDLLIEEVRDRFGPLPKETLNLAELMRLRALLRIYGVVRAEFANKKLLLSFSPQAPVDVQKILALEKREPKRFKFGKALTLSILTTFEVLESPAELLPVVEQVLNEIAR